MRINSTLYFVLKDHLSSASVVTNANGITVSEQRYYPFGETRLTTGTIYTDRLFTGQREITGLGIYHYGARFYSPYINQFLSADTIVPGYSNPQNLNRYSYVLNNPLKYTDPTGHRPCGDGEAVDCDGYSNNPTPSNAGCGGPGKPSCGGNSGGGEDGRGGDGGRPLPIPNPSDMDDVLPPGCGQAGFYSPRCSGWHFYTTTNLVCPAEFRCMIEEMIDYLSRFAYPGQDPSEPVRNLDINPVGDPWTKHPAPGRLGLIQTAILNGGLMIKNVTQPGHVFYDGAVLRKVYQAEDGAWYASTYGYGNNVNPHMDTLNQGLGDDIFNEVDRQMLNYIEERQ